MIIKLIRWKNLLVILKIEKKYKCSYPIISLGCDCHPAHLLQALNIRNTSLPFDWLNTKSSAGIDYVSNNIKNDFEFWLKNLKINSRNYVVSSNFEYAEFMHYENLINNNSMINILTKRAKKFMHYFSNVNCLFLYNLKSDGIKTDNDVNFFLNSIKEFTALSGRGHILMIYISHDEDVIENEQYVEYVEKELRTSTKIRVARFVLRKNEFGIWGDESKYADLLRSLGVKLRIGLPKIRIE